MTLIASVSTRLALDASFKPDHDIRLFLRATFRDIKKTHRSRDSIPTTWPDDNTLTEVVRKSTGG